MLYNILYYASTHSPQAESQHMSQRPRRHTRCCPSTAPPPPCSQRSGPARRYLYESNIIHVSIYEHK